MTKALKILLADDDADILYLVTELLHDKGHDVTVARSGTELLRLVQPDPRKFDVIVTDNAMPGGPSGIDVLRSLRRDTVFDEVVIIVHSSTEHVKGEAELLRAIYALKAAGFDDLFRAIDLIQRALHYRSHP